VPVLGSDVVAHAGLELPGLAAGNVGHRAGAGNDVVRFPVMLVPEGGLGARRKVHVRETEAETVRLGQHAERARLAVGGAHLPAPAGRMASARLPNMRRSVFAMGPRAS